MLLFAHACCQRYKDIGYDMNTFVGHMINIPTIGRKTSLVDSKTNMSIWHRVATLPLKQGLFRIFETNIAYIIMGTRSVSYVFHVKGGILIEQVADMWDQGYDSPIVNKTGVINRRWRDRTTVRYICFQDDDSAVIWPTVSDNVIFNGVKRNHVFPSWSHSKMPITFIHKCTFAYLVSGKQIEKVMHR